MTITIDDLTTRQRRFLKKHNVLDVYLKDVNHGTYNTLNIKGILRRDEWDFIDRTLRWSRHAFDWCKLDRKAGVEYDSINLYEISNKLEIL